MTTGALDGLRVLDLSNQLSGPYCAMLLGDLGAEVIKVEHPVGGDNARQGAPHVNGESAPFMTVNRNKRSITVDLKAPDGLSIVRRLAARADVVLENWRPGTAARLGLGYDNARRLNPRVIYCPISRFGQPRPHASRGRVHRTADGWINLGGGAQQLWRDIGAVRGVEPLADDPRFATPALRVQHTKELEALLQPHFLSAPTSVWLEKLEAAGVPAGPILSYDQVFADPHVKARAMAVEVDHARAGRTRVLGIPFKLSKTPGAVRRPAPTLGQHTDEILGELGYDTAAIADLRTRKVV